MKQVCKSFDDKIFETEEECLKHELNAIGDDLQMYDDEGYRTYEIDEARVVYIKNEIACELFANIDNFYYPERGGQYGGIGINVLSQVDNTWYLLTPDCLAGLRYLFEEEIK
ncbi:MAG: hypothetical protein SPF43_09905 [Bacteroidales bacterium]|nr:hypothetical protein [Bacteroidales bacterium]